MTAPEHMGVVNVEHLQRLLLAGPVVAIAKCHNGGRATICQAVDRVGGWRPGGGLWLPFRESELEVVRAVAAEGGWSVEVVDGVAFVSKTDEGNAPESSMDDCAGARPGEAWKAYSAIVTTMGEPIAGYEVTVDLTPTGAEVAEVVPLSRKDPRWHSEILAEGAEMRPTEEPCEWTRVTIGGVEYPPPVEASQAAYDVYVKMARCAADEITLTLLGNPVRHSVRVLRPEDVSPEHCPVCVEAAGARRRMVAVEPCPVHVRVEEGA